MGLVCRTALGFVVVASVGCASRLQSAQPPAISHDTSSQQQSFKQSVEGGQIVLGKWRLGTERNTFVRTVLKDSTVLKGDTTARATAVHTENFLRSLPETFLTKEENQILAQSEENAKRVPGSADQSSGSDQEDSSAGELREDEGEVEIAARPEAATVPQGTLKGVVQRALSPAVKDSSSEINLAKNNSGQDFGGVGSKAQGTPVETAALALHAVPTASSGALSRPLGPQDLPRFMLASQNKEAQNSPKEAAVVPQVKKAEPVGSSTPAALKRLSEESRPLPSASYTLVAVLSAVGVFLIIALTFVAYRVHLIRAEEERNRRRYR